MILFKKYVVYSKTEQSVDLDGQRVFVRPLMGWSPSPALCSVCRTEARNSERFLEDDMGAEIGHYRHVNQPERKKRGKSSQGAVRSQSSCRVRPVVF